MAKPALYWIYNKGKQNIFHTKTTSIMKLYQLQSVREHFKRNEFLNKQNVAVHRRQKRWESTTAEMEERKNWIRRYGPLDSEEKWGSVLIRDDRYASSVLFLCFPVLRALFSDWLPCGLSSVRKSESEKAACALPRTIRLIFVLSYSAKSYKIKLFSLQMP